MQSARLGTSGFCCIPEIDVNCEPLGIHLDLEALRVVRVLPGHPPSGIISSDPLLSETLRS